MKSFLPRLMSTITRKPRSFQHVEYLPGHWVQNAFRFYESLFGRECHSNGDAIIRPHMSASISPEGKVVYVYHTVEAFLAHAEAAIRSLRPVRFPVRIWIPILQPAGGGLPMFASPYLFAIAYDNAQGAIGAPTATITNFVVGATNPLINWACTNDGAFANQDNMSAVTFNGVSAFSNLVVKGGAQSRYQYIFYLAGQSGTHNVVATQSTSNSVRMSVTSYTGAAQTSTVDGSSSVTSAAATTITNTSTVTAANCWLFTLVYNDSVNNYSGGTRTTLRSQSGLPGDGYGGCGDSGGAVGTGSQSTQWSTSGSSNWGSAQYSFKPAAAAPSAKGNFLAFMGGHK